MDDKVILKEWFCDPKTPKNHWMNFTFAEIDKMLDTKHACKDIPKIIAEKTGKKECEVRNERNAYRKKISCLTLEIKKRFANSQPQIIITMR